MSQRTLLTLFCLLGTATMCLSAQTKTPTDTQFEKRLHGFVDQKKAPGIVAGLVDEKGVRVIAYGNSKSGTTSAVDGDSLFEIGSITKVFTALMLQDMADKGEVRLDDPIGKFLPPTVKPPSRNGKQITLVDLATHTSGLPRLPDNLIGLRALLHQDNPYADYTPEQLYEFLSSYKLTRDIGIKYEYSNLGGGLLGHLLSLKGGTNYESLIIGRVCEPLKMYDTRITLSADMQSRLATGHNDKGKPVSNWDFKTLEGCGALRSSVNDMLKFLSANMGIGAFPLAQSIARTHVPLRDADFGGKVALGWHINTAGIIWHNGGTGGYRSFIGFNPEIKRGVVVLCNSANGVDDLGLSTLTAKKSHHQVPMDVGIYDRYVGQYKFGPGAILTVSRDGDRFLARLTGQQDLEFFPESETDFFCKVVDAQLTFLRGETGPTTHVVLHQAGLDQKAPKVK